MKIKENFVLKQVADTYIVVPLGAANVDFNTIISLNETGAFLWKALETETDRDSIIERLLGEYDVSREKAEVDVDAFILKVQQAGLLV